MHVFEDKLVPRLFLISSHWPYFNVGSGLWHSLRWWLITVVSIKSYVVETQGHSNTYILVIHKYSSKLTPCIISHAYEILSYVISSHVAFADHIAKKQNRTTTPNKNVGEFRYNYLIKGLHFWSKYCVYIYIEACDSFTFRFKTSLFYNQVVKNHKRRPQWYREKKFNSFRNEKTWCLWQDARRSWWSNRFYKGGQYYRLILLYPSYVCR